MSVARSIAMVLQIVLIVAVAPVVVGITRQSRARLEGRAGAGVWQPWRDLRKLSGKQSLRPDGTTLVFLAAPVVMTGSMLVVAGIVPVIVAGSPASRVGDLLVVVGLLLVSTVTLALAGLDTGTAFGGMGSSRELTIAALVEPSLLLAVFALSVPVHSTNLSVIVAAVAHDPASASRPGAVLAGVALIVALLAEAGRLPVDNPATHLELTMVHEAMALEYSGPPLALIELASAMRLTLLLSLLINLFAPAGVAIASVTAGSVLLALAAIVVKLVVLAALLGAGEVFLAKLRLFRVPELLAGAFLLGLLAVTASAVVTAPAR